MAEVPIPFGDWRPDVALLDNQFISVAENVLPGANTYLPMPGLSFVSTSTLGTGNDNYTKILLHMDGSDAATSFPDSAMGASTSHTWTAAGNAQVDTAQSKFGGASLLCDGTGDWISTPNVEADMALGSSNFTIDSWVRPAVDGTQMYLAGQCDNIGANARWVLFRNASNKINFNAYSSGVATTLTSSTSIVAGAWYHIEVWRSGNSLALAINGTQEHSVGFTTSVDTSSNALRIGAGGEITTTPWNGWIDEFRMSVGVARHTATFTAPTAFYDACRGLFMARMSTGLDAFFAGTAIKLYKWTYASNAWTDVSRAAGGNYNLAAGDLWSFEKFGDNVYATHVNDVLQSIDATSGTNFAAVSGSPPQAGHVKGVGDFLVLSGLSTNKRKIQWSAINDPTGWTVGTSLSDEQVFPDGGDVRGIAGDTIGIVVQDNCLRSMQFLPGDTDRIFAFSKVEEQRGCPGKLAFTFTNGTLFFRGGDGFFAWGGGGLQNIGQDAFNEWFGANANGGVDTARYDEIVCFLEPGTSRVYFAFYNATTSQTYDRLLVFDWHLNKATYATRAAQMWAAGANSTLVKKIVGVDTSGEFATFTGSSLGATIDTAEYHLNPGMRTMVTNVYALADTSAGSGNITITPYTRERLEDTSVAGTAVTLESNGWHGVLSSGRLHKFRLSFAGGQWTYASGLMVDHQPDGEA